MSDSISKRQVVLIVAEDSPERDQLILAAGKFGGKTLLAQNEAVAIQYLQAYIVDVVLFAAKSPLSSAFSFIRSASIRGGDAPPIFLIADQADSAVDEAFYEGVGGIFFRPIDQQELVDGVIFSYVNHVGDSQRAHTRRSLSHSRATYQFKGQTSRGVAVDFSCGGMFIASMEVLPEMNDVIELSVNFEGHPIELKFKGSVRWVRAKIELGKPRGFGVQFIDVEPANITSIELILRRDPM